MKYFVTGTTGFIGGRVARQLLATGHEVITLARTPAAAQVLVALGVKVHAGDTTDKESLRAPMTGVDGVFHIAAWYKIGVRDMSQAEAINVGGTRNVLTMMKELGIPKGCVARNMEEREWAERSRIVCLRQRLQRAWRPAQPALSHRLFRRPALALFASCS